MSVDSLHEGPEPRRRLEKWNIVRPWAGSDRRGDLKATLDKQPKLTLHQRLLGTNSLRNAGVPLGDVVTERLQRHVLDAE
jgi:hypothetical protein